MRNLGPASEKQLAEVGITSAEQLREIGAFKAARMMEEKGTKHVYNGKLHKAFLYALIGAIEDRSWQEVARAAKQNLVI